MTPISVGSDCCSPMPLDKASSNTMMFPSILVLSRTCLPYMRSSAQLLWLLLSLTLSASHYSKPKTHQIHSYSDKTTFIKNLEKKKNLNWGKIVVYLHLSFLGQEPFGLPCLGTFLVSFLTQSALDSLLVSMSPPHSVLRDS